MKTALILLSILGMACAFSMKHFHRRAKLENSEENGVFKYRPRYYLYKHGYFYPPLKRFPVQSSDSSEENEDGDSSDEEEEEETSNEEENNEESNENEDEESEAENSTLSATTPGYGEQTTLGTGNAGLAAIQLPKTAGDLGKKSTKKEESDEEEEEEEENENEENEAEVDESGQGINGTSTNSTEAHSGNGSSGGDNGEEGGEEESVPDANAEGTTVAGEQDSGNFEPTAPPPEVYGTTPRPLGETTAAEYEGEYEQTGTNEYDNGYEVYENENGQPRGDNYRAYEDEYSYYKGRSYDSYDGQNYYYHQ